MVYAESALSRLFLELGTDKALTTRYLASYPVGKRSHTTAHPETGCPGRRPDPTGRTTTLTTQFLLLLDGPAPSKGRSASDLDGRLIIRSLGLFAGLVLLVGLEAGQCERSGRYRVN